MKGNIFCNKFSSAPKIPLAVQIKKKMPMAERVFQTNVSV
jgi:hypothetical protein